MHKYGVYMKSVYLTWQTRDFTEILNENQSKVKIEQISVYLTWLTWDLTKSWTEMCPSVRLN